MEMLDTINEMIQLNNKELLSMTKEYMIVYIKSLLFDLYGTKRRNQLRNSIYQYGDTIKLENLYLKLLADNINSIDIERTEEFIEKLDALNENTFYYYECVLNAYEENIFQEETEQIRLPYREFTTITENENYYLELLSIFSNQEDIEINSNTRKINKILQKNQKEV